MYEKACLNIVGGQICFWDEFEGSPQEAEALMVL